MTIPAPCYLYGFIRASDSPLPAMTGVYGAPVHTTTSNGVTAVVSTLPATDLRARRDDLLAHSEVLQTLIDDRDVVPAHFGSVYPQGFDLDQLPKPQLKSLRRLLDDLGGRIEVQVKAMYVQDAVTQAIVAADGRLRRLRDRRQDYATQLAVGTRFAEMLDRRRSADTSAVVKRLSSSTVRVAVEPASGEWGAFKLACLVDKRKRDAFERTLTGLAEELNPLMELGWVGPLPP